MVRSLSFVLSLSFFGMSAQATMFVDVAPGAAVSDIKSKNKQVVTLIGFSGAGYQATKEVMSLIENKLKAFDSKKTVINIGATPEGIGEVYEIAKKMGFETTGIVSSQAKEYKDSIRPAVDKVYFIQDSTWGGLSADGKTLNPTSKAMVEASSRVIAVGGGDVGRDEMKAAMAKGIPVDFVGADMNYEIALKKAAKKGQPAPTEFRGSAELEMLAMKKTFPRVTSQKPATAAAPSGPAPAKARSTQ